MKSITEVTQKRKLPVRVLQFGQGNFLRAFVDYMIDVYNEKCDGNLGIVIIKNTKGGNVSLYEEQKNLFTVVVRGILENRTYCENRIIRSVQDIFSIYDDYMKFEEYVKLDTLRFIVSNTTEAGIVCSENDKYGDTPPASYPAKLVKLLFQRYSHFNGDSSKGLIIIPTELIDNNGEVLKDCVLKTISRFCLPDEFKHWVEESCIFCSTLVDRIVSGFPSDSEQIFEEIGYRDRLMTTCEPYSLFVIQSERDITDELPLHKANLPVIFTNDATPYRKRKLHILNGAHTASVVSGFLHGFNTVYEMMQNEVFVQYIRRFLFEEVIPTIGIEKNELEQFAESVFTRFSNPYLNHYLEAISVNSITKFIARILPSFKQYYVMYDRLPNTMLFSLAAILVFYMSQSKDRLIGRRENGDEYSAIETGQITEYLLKYSSKNNFVELVLSNATIWGENLCRYDGLYSLVNNYVNSIMQNGVINTMSCIL